MKPSKTTPSVLELAELCDAVYLGKSKVEILVPTSGANTSPTGSLATSARQNAGPPAFSQSVPTTRMSGTTPKMPDRPKPIGLSLSSGEKKIVWTKKSAWHNKVGFYCAIYCRETDGVGALVFRGTDDLWDGLIDDTQVAVGAVPQQVTAALQVARAAGLDKDAYVSGHSLGGALAIITAAHQSMPAVTFNAPGVMDSCVLSSGNSGLGRMLDILRRCVSNSRILNKRIDADPVSSWFTTGFQTGGRSTALKAAQCGFDLKCRHGMSTCIEVLRRDNGNFQPLDL